MPVAWNRFVYVLGSCCCYELETALLKCVDDRMPAILRNVREVQDHASSCGRQMLLHHDGQYFEVYSKAAAATENGLDERPMDDLKIARAARVIQRSWRSKRTQVDKQHVAPPNLPATETTGDKSEAQVWLEGRGLAKYWGRLEAKGYDDLQVLWEADAQEIDGVLAICDMPRGHAGHFKRGLALIPAGPDPAELLRRIATDGLEGVVAIEAWLRGRGAAFAKYAEVMVSEGYNDLQILQDADDEEVASLIIECGMAPGHALHFWRGLSHIRRWFGALRTGPLDPCPKA